VAHTSSSTPTYNLLDWFLAPRLGRGTELERMLRTAEELRDHPALLRSALHVLLHNESALATVAARSSPHANGFVKVVLSHGDNWSLRLHVWSPSVKPAYDDLNPHGHRWAFASWIITGTLREITFVEDHRGQVFRRCEYGHDPHAPWTLRTKDSATLMAGEPVDREAGTVYERTGAEVHTAVPRSDLVATLVLQGPHRAETTEVFLGPDNLAKVGEHGDEPLLVDDLKVLVREVVDALQ
jgi:hypothetical protein